MGPLQALFSRVSAVCRRIIASNFQGRGPRFSIRHFIRHTAVGSALSILSRFVTSTSTSTSTMLRAPSVIRWRGRRRGRKGRGEAMKRRGDITFSFPLSGIGSSNLPRRRFAKITSRCSRCRLSPRRRYHPLGASEVSSRPIAAGKNI